jgi:hypothetical protein
MSKPTGSIGPYRISYNQNGLINGSFEPIQFPKDKREIEKYIVESFISSMNNCFMKKGKKFILSNPEHNAENDFDFTVASPDGSAYLELMEIAPLSGPYDQAPSRYKAYDFAKTILEGILQKSQHYDQKITRHLFLLLYVTHWAFILSDLTIACLQYWCDKKPTAFRAIFSYSLLDKQEGVPKWISPIPPQALGSFDPEQFKDNECIILDPKKWEKGK